MFCSNCGKEIDDKAVVCVHCGCATKNHVQQQKPNKSMLCAVILWFFLGGIGAHRFYIGDTTGGVLMLLCLLFCWLVIPAIVLLIWWVIDIFLLVTGALKPKDGTALV